MVMSFKQLGLTYCGILLLIYPQSSTSLGNTSPERTYVFAFSYDGFPNNYITDNNTLDGQSVRLVKKVCERAGKSCDTAVVPRRDCWDTTTKPALSKVLDEDWFDACANLPPSSQRLLGYQYAPVYYFKTLYPSVIAKSGSHIKLEDLKSCNTLRMAYLDNLGLTPDCLLTTSYWVNSCNLVKISAESSITTGTAKVVKAVLKGQADIGLVVTKFLNPKGVKILGQVPCSGDLRMNLNIMMRKDNCALYKWWNDALKDFICRDYTQYKLFCEQLARDFNGIDPLCLKPGIDIDCNSLDGRMKDTNSHNIQRINPCFYPSKKKPRKDQNYKPDPEPETRSYNPIQRKPKTKAPVYKPEPKTKAPVTEKPKPEIQTPVYKTKEKRRKNKRPKEKKSKSKSKSDKSKTNMGSEMKNSRAIEKENESSEYGQTNKNFTIGLGFNFRGNSNQQPKMPAKFGLEDSPMAKYFKSLLSAKEKKLQEKKAKEAKNET